MGYRSVHDEGVRKSSRLEVAVAQLDAAARGDGGEGAIDGVGDVQIEFAREDAPGAMDDMIVRLELTADDALAYKISEDLRAAVSMRPTIDFVRRGTLYDEAKSLKLRRIIDSRPRAD